MVKLVYEMSKEKGNSFGYCTIVLLYSQYAALVFQNVCFDF